MPVEMRRRTGGRSAAHREQVAGGLQCQILYATFGFRRQQRGTLFPVIADGTSAVRTRPRRPGRRRRQEPLLPTNAADDSRPTTLPATGVLGGIRCCRIHTYGRVRSRSAASATTAQDSGGDRVQDQLGLRTAWPGPGSSGLSNRSTRRRTFSRCREWWCHCRFEPVPSRPSRAWMTPPRGSVGMSAAALRTGIVTGG